MHQESEQHRSNITTLFIFIFPQQIIVQIIRTEAYVLLHQIEQKLTCFTAVGHVVLMKLQHEKHST